VLIKLPSGVIKVIKIDSQKVNLGRIGSFKASELIDKVYGQTYEILEEGQLEAVKATLNEIGESSQFTVHKAILLTDLSRLQRRPPRTTSTSLLPVHKTSHS